jgi:hypothetical protein
MKSRFKMLPPRHQMIYTLTHVVALFAVIVLMQFALAGEGAKAVGAAIAACMLAGFSGYLVGMNQMYHHIIGKHK